MDVDLMQMDVVWQFIFLFLLALEINQNHFFCAMSPWIQEWDLAGESW